MKKIEAKLLRDVLSDFIDKNEFFNTKDIEARLDATQIPYSSGYVSGVMKEFCDQGRITASGASGSKRSMNSYMRV